MNIKSAVMAAAAALTLAAPAAALAHPYEVWGQASYSDRGVDRYSPSVYAPVFSGARYDRDDWRRREWIREEQQREWRREQWLRHERWEHQNRYDYGYYGR